MNTIGDNTEITHWINGQKVISQNGDKMDIYDPKHGSVTKSYDLAGKVEVDKAVSSAKRAFQDWRHVPPPKKAQIMFNYRELILENIEALAKAVSIEHGKTLDDAKGSVMRGVEVVEYCCNIASHLRSDFTPTVADGIDSFNLRQPLGVCAGITPFNFPAMVPMWMFPMAISCGNTFVLKPSEKDPSCPLMLAKLLERAGLPKGVLNVVVGGKHAVNAILDHEDIAAVSFVGSTAIGEYVYKKGTSNGKRVQALCGAKNHMVVMPDADMSQAGDAIIGAAYGSAGERCMAISVVIAVGDETADDLIERLAPRIKNLKVGPWDRDGIEMGPVISGEALSKIKSYVDKGVAQGANLVVDGRDLEVDGHENGFFIGGCLFDNVKPDMDIYKDEIFGPVLSVVRVKNYEEALRLVSDHEYGNGTCIFTRDGDTARDFFLNVKIGMVGINVPIPVPVAFHSFGGWKTFDIRGSCDLWSGRNPFLYQVKDGDFPLAFGYQGRLGFQFRKEFRPEVT